MKPPWEAHPEVPAGSIGWRMGYGEDYWMRFSGWFETLSPQDREFYRREHPEPADWAGFYANNADH
jgi:hypothetical protein